MNRIFIIISGLFLIGCATEKIQQPKPIEALLPSPLISFVLLNSQTGIPAVNNGTLNPDTGEVNWLPTCLEGGVYDVNFSASDGKLENCKSAKITVVKDVYCNMTLSDFVGKYLKPNANLQHYAIWAGKGE